MAKSWRGLAKSAILMAKQNTIIALWANSRGGRVGSLSSGGDWPGVLLTQSVSRP